MPDEAEKTMPSIYDIEAVDHEFRKQRVDPEELRRFRNAFFKKDRDEKSVREELSPPSRAKMKERVRFGHLDVIERHDSSLDGASKLIFRTGQGFVIEAVILRITSGRTALCISSQVGCAANCDFCATAKMGVAHNLVAEEILDQVRLANRALAKEERRVRNVVFMGMGEPFHNEGELYRALDVLTSPRCFDYSEGRILVSTVGLPDAMLRCARRFPRVHLALSLHSARQAVRESIVPLARQHPLDELRAAIEDVIAIQGQRVMIEYLMLAGINDGEEDLEALSLYLEGLDVHINLIPYNPIDEAPHLHSTPVDRQREFSDALKQRGFVVTSRYSLGTDIAAACGQLVQRENRQVANRLKSRID